MPPGGSARENAWGCGHGQRVRIPDVEFGVRGEHSVGQQVTKLGLGPSVDDAVNDAVQVSARVDVVRDARGSVHWRGRRIPEDIRGQRGFEPLLGRPSVTEVSWAMRRASSSMSRFHRSAIRSSRRPRWRGAVSCHPGNAFCERPARRARHPGRRQEWRPPGCVARGFQRSVAGRAVDPGAVDQHSNVAEIRDGGRGGLLGLLTWAKFLCADTSVIAGRR